MYFYGYMQQQPHAFVNKHKHYNMIQSFNTISINQLITIFSLFSVCLLVSL